MSKTQDRGEHATPAELQMMLGSPGADAPMLKKGLDALMAAYPDTTEDDRDG